MKQDVFQSSYMLTQYPRIWTFLLAKGEFHAILMALPVVVITWSISGVMIPGHRITRGWDRVLSRDSLLARAWTSNLYSRHMWPATIDWLPKSRLYLRYDYVVIDYSSCSNKARAALFRPKGSSSQGAVPLFSKNFYLTKGFSFCFSSIFSVLKRLPPFE